METNEERKQMVMEYLERIYFDKESISFGQLYSIALYLYQNAELGPRGTKKVAAYLVKLSDIYYSEGSLQDIDVEKRKNILKKLNTCFDYRAVYQFTLNKAKQLLKEKNNKLFVYEGYRYMLEGHYHQLDIAVIQKENRNIFEKTKEQFQNEYMDYKNMYDHMNSIIKLQKVNDNKRKEIVRNLLNTKARLEVIARMTETYERKKQLSQVIAELDLILQEEQYDKMQAETAFGNVIFAQATRSASYQKQVTKVIDYNRYI